MRHLAALVLIVLVASCGRSVDDADVTARNLATGEVQIFGSAGEVPEGWAICSDPSCSVPPEVPCQKLSSKTCALNPECRLKTLWCTGEGTASSDGTSTNGSQTCETTCIPKLPLLCEELTDEKSCAARTDCLWGQFMCPAIACDPNSPTPCPVCPSSCQTKTPETCDVLGEKDCKARQDCAWGLNACPACMGPGCECKPTCSPAGLQPCADSDCPLLGMPNYLCSDGQTVAGPGQCVRQANGTCQREMITCPAPPPTTCGPNDCGPALGMPNYVCPDGKTIAGPTGKCLLQNGKCGWEVVSCPPSTTPVCKVTGCSGTVCAAVDKPTTCEWADYYQCYTKAICEAKNGVCGWTETPDFLACMALYKKP